MVNRKLVAKLEKLKIVTLQLLIVYPMRRYARLSNNLCANLMDARKSHGKGGAINLRLMGVWPYCKSSPLGFFDCLRRRSIWDEMSVTTSNARLKYYFEMPISKNTMIRSTIFKRQNVSLFAKLCKFPNFAFQVLENRLNDNENEKQKKNKTRALRCWHTNFFDAEESETERREIVVMRWIGMTRGGLELSTEFSALRRHIK